MNDREHIRANALDGFMSSFYNRENVSFAFVNLFMHILPSLAVKLQHSWIDRAWEKIESCLTK